MNFLRYGIPADRPLRPTPLRRPATRLWLLARWLTIALASTLQLAAADEIGLEAGPGVYYYNTVFGKHPVTAYGFNYPEYSAPYFSGTGSNVLNGSQRSYDGYGLHIEIDRQPQWGKPFTFSTSVNPNDPRWRYRATSGYGPSRLDSISVDLWSTRYGNTPDRFSLDSTTPRYVYVEPEIPFTEQLACPAELGACRFTATIAEPLNTVRGWGVFQIGLFADCIATDGSCVGQNREIALALIIEFEPGAPNGTGGLEVGLAATNPDGSALQEQTSVQHDFLAKLTIANNSESTLKDFRFAGNRALAVDPRGTGRIAVTSRPAIDPKLTLAPGQSADFTFAVTTLREGLAAAHTRVTATDDKGNDVSDGHSLLFRIANAQQLSEDINNYLIVKAMDQFLFRNVREMQGAMRRQSIRLAAGIRKVLSVDERLQWFGPGGKLNISNTDRAIAFLRGVPPEQIAAQMPKVAFQGHTVEELNEAYNATFKEEAKKGLAQWAQGYLDLEASLRKAADDSWAEGIMNTKWLMNIATPDERAQVEAFWNTFAAGVGGDVETIHSTLSREIPRWQENGLYMWQAMKEADKELRLTNLAKKSYNFWNNLVAKESRFRAETLKLASQDPVRFQQEWAKRDAAIFNTGLPVILDTLLGAGVAKVGTAVKSVTVAREGASVIEAGKAAGWLDEAGLVAETPNPLMELAETTAANGVDLQTANQLTQGKGLLKNMEGATLVQSSAVGDVYSLPNLGGVPEKTLEAKAGILKDLEDAYTQATGKALKLVEVLKTSSPLRKEGSVAKLELTAAKTGKPEMIDAGMPPDALGEAAYWHNPVDPSTTTAFKNLPKARQEKAMAEWKKAEERWLAYETPAPGSKEAKLKQLVGKRSRVPLDDQPNAAGLQRFVTGEFEEVVVTNGTGEAKLIRVKHYEVEVWQVDENQALKINSKIVIDNLPVAAAQTADADAVAIGKLKGYDPKTGAPIVDPLSRAEREFVMSRYIDKNIKARRAGLIPDLAEHGVTLNMEDASAKAAGKLLPAYGAPFMPEAIARQYLERIAPFVKPADLTNDQMVEKMLALVRNEGGFGQHAVVVTSDSRYLGAVPFAKW